MPTVFPPINALPTAGVLFLPSAPYFDDRRLIEGVSLEHASTPSFCYFSDRPLRRFDFTRYCLSRRHLLRANAQSLQILSLSAARRANTTNSILHAGACATTYLKFILPSSMPRASTALFYATAFCQHAKWPTAPQIITLPLSPAVLCLLLLLMA